MDGIHNQQLYEVVKALYDKIIAGFASESADFHSKEFLSSFPYWFLHDADERSKKIAAALAPEFRTEAEKCIEACYSHSAGGDVPYGWKACIRTTCEDALMGSCQLSMGENPSEWNIG
jgi:hypothetical protein